MISIRDWEEFKGTEIYDVILKELQERYDIVLSNLIKGNDSEWSDDNMRGRLSEIEYTQGLVDAIITDMKIEEINKKAEDKGFIANLINKIKGEE